MKNTKSNVVSQAQALAQTVAEELGYSLWDVTFEKEGADYVLEITIDKEEGVDIDDCEKMSRAIDPLLDEKDFIDESYRLEVSSPGLERQVRTEQHLEKSIGQKITAKFYAPQNGVKSVTGTLSGYTEKTVTLDGTEYEREKIAKMNYYFEF